MPLVWLVWQVLAGTHSVDPELTRPTLKHFVGCVLCFYLGYFCLSGVRRVGLFWVGLVCGLLVVLAVGWEQQFGGLKETRRYFFLYIYPQLKEVSPEYLKKMSSDRIFSTLFYPNTLAGALLLLLPASLAALWLMRQLLTAAARWFLIGLVGIAGLACLYWSGSKGGWLLMLMLGLVALLRLPFNQRLKVVLVTGILFAGLAGFFWRHAIFFQKGATSVSARFDYWRAAVQTAKDKPLFGSGPGTFAIAYKKVKRPESEMARLVHNDYLEQASDSGLVGFLAYALFIISALVWSRPWPRRASVAHESRHERDGPLSLSLSSSKGERVPKAGEGLAHGPNTRRDTVEATQPEDWLTFAVWLGVLGWALQGFAEFGLYVPALAWTAFALLGWLVGRQNPAQSKGPTSHGQPAAP
jgi:O-antigen ligase